ncbi:NTP transferase domain-containing protein [Aliihoeflea sp. 40Bstr573]|uniref:NTP transferase domain-containing protein n=1 Tax=Aliihoeflea sp. 40Bstr573 TaxID=2696467 RepID=UPI0020958F04|nr:NTP transferase domain-containing protein [Aliihoeflea sp. 40Bstr573]
MKFGPLTLDQAEGALLAHSVSVPALRLKKAHRLTASDIASLRAAGIETVIGAVLETGDVPENDAAARLAVALSVDGVEIREPATGRVNIHAREAGVFAVDRAIIDAINRVDPALTIATLAPFEAVQSGQMVATVKVIPFAAPEIALRAASDAARGGQAFAVHAFRPRRVALVQTTLPGIKPSVLDKTARVTADRLGRSHSTIGTELRVPHDDLALAKALSDLDVDTQLVLVFGASALCDWDDVIPAAIRRAGGMVERAGMPVDPGNLLVLGSLDGRTIIGAPGCARSPKPNGFDWVLDRLIAGMPVTADDIAGMGVGGLLMEIPVRPQPRDTTSAAATRPVVHAAILAAGRSSRMHGPNKLLAEFDGEPLIRRVAEAVTNSSVDATHVVLGHQRDRVASALGGLDLAMVENPEYADGLSTSLKAAERALPPEVNGLLVVLGDMPGVTAKAIDAMLEAFAGAGGQAIIRATDAGKRGNPVLLPRALFAQIERIEGDTGARHLVECAALPVVDVELGAAASLDLDTQEAVRQAGGNIVEGA